MFERLKQLFGGGSGGDNRSGGARGAAARRPAQPRARPKPGGAAASSAAASASAGASGAGFGPAHGGATGRKAGRPGSSRAAETFDLDISVVGDLPPEITPSEIPCPNCGEPMLSKWGTTCGKCRPNLVAPKTLFMEPGVAASFSQATAGMTLGWLVVGASTDAKRRGTLIELEHDDSILSRAAAIPSRDPRLIEFADAFMSSGHAVVRRPQTGNRNDAFTIRDRDTPSPSANGTFVNSRRLGASENVRLADGDVVQVGSTELVFRSLWLPASPARRS